MTDQREQAKAILERDFAALEKKVKGGKPLTVAERALVMASQHGAEVSDVPHDGMVRSRRAAARMFGVSEFTVRRWELLPGYPERNEGNAWDVSALLAWRATADVKQGEDAPAVTDQKARRLLLQNEKLQEEICVLKGAHTPNDVIAAFLVSTMSSMNAVLIQKECEMPARLAGLDVPTIRERLKKEFDGLRLRLQQAIKTWEAENKERFEK